MSFSKFSSWPKKADNNGKTLLETLLSKLNDSDRLELLNKERFIDKLGKLDDEDLNRIYKAMYLIRNRYKNLKKFKHKKFYYEIGDIILYKKQKYYIYGIDDNYYYTKIVNEPRKKRNTF